MLVQEDLLGFLECDTGISGRALADKITSTVQAYGLDLSHLRGKAYDEAGNMSGSVNGTAALITADYPLALYLHCASHYLNLAVVSSLQVTSVRNMMSVVGRVYQFVATHPKRQRALEKAISDTQPASRVHRLKDLCPNRYKSSALYTNLLLLARRAFATMSHVYGVQIQSVMLEACYLLSAPPTFSQH